jgi:hypothetical protein
MGQNLQIWNKFGLVRNDIQSNYNVRKSVCRDRFKQRVSDKTTSLSSIGKSIATILAKKHPQDIVVLTARSKDLGEATVKELHETEIKNIDFHVLDVTSKSSAGDLHDYLEKKYGKINVLINNAGWDPMVQKSMKRLLV